MIQTGKEFRDALLSARAGALVRRILDHDGEYLLLAYSRIERFWNDNFKKIQRANLIILSEAPLFGDDEKYFYNPDAGMSPFFNYSDYKEVFAGYGAPIPSTGTGATRKDALLDALGALGVLILDLFPFALNQSTIVNYSSLSEAERRQLFFETCPHYFRPKLAAIAQKSTPRSLFVFRYARVRDACADLIERELEGIGLGKQCLAYGSIGRAQGNLDRKRLRMLYEKSVSDA